MRCETTSSVKECALRARSTHGVHHAIVEVNIVIGVVLGEVLVARVVPLVVDAVIGLALSLIAHVVVVVFVVAILQRIFLYMRYTLYTFRGRVTWFLQDSSNTLVAPRSASKERQHGEGHSIGQASTSAVWCLLSRCQPHTLFPRDCD